MAESAMAHQVMAWHGGKRRRERGAQLWAQVPEVSQQPAAFHTDVEEAYKCVIPPERHKAIPKKARTAKHVERFNNTLRQGVSRLVRDTLSFSKKLTNPIGAIKFCRCHDHLATAAASPV